MPSAIEPLFTQPAAQAVAWALLQFLWQGAVIGVITAAALLALRRAAPDVRYVVGAIGLSVMLTMPVVTAVQAWRGSDHAEVYVTSQTGSSGAEVGGEAFQARVTAIASLPAVEPDAAVVPAKSRTPARDWNSLLSLMLLGWVCGVGILTLRLIGGWMWVRRMTSHGTAPASAVIQEIAARIARNLHIRRTVTYLQSTLVDVPTVIGWLKPVVLVPASALSALTPQQLEAIIAHELAHIRRHDYLVNLLQTLVETLLFYHPAVWWLSRRIRLERENCCDDLAVSLCGDAVTYARALADLEELRGLGLSRRASRKLALAADGGSLLQRVRRLLGAPTHAGRGPGWLAGSAAVLLIAGIAAGAIGNAAFMSEQAPAVAAVQPSAPAAPAIARAAVEPARAAEVTAPAAPVEPAVIAAMPALPEPGEPAVVAPMPMLAAGPVGADAVAVEPLEPAEAPEPAEALEPPAPAAPAPVEAVAAQASASSSREHSSSWQHKSDDDQKGNYIWSNDNQRIEIEYKGRIEFTDDDADVKALSPGGYLRIREGRLPNRTSVEFDADDKGNIIRRYWSGTSERPFEPEGRQWLARTLPRFIRQSGIGASARVARIYRAKGVDGVLAEIQLIEGSWSRRVYYSELLKTATLEPRTIAQVLTRAGKDLESDFELASLLTGYGDKLLVDDMTRRAYFDAARSIESDFELRRVYSSALKRGPVSSEILTGLLDASLSIESDFELASLLVDVAKLQPLDARSRPAFFKSLAGVESDFEHKRVLNTLASRTDLDETTVRDLLESSVLVDSDFEQAALLMTVLKRYPVEGATRQPFFRAVDSIGSSFERARVLNAVAKRTDVSAETVMAILRSTKGIDSSFESSRVLQAVAASHPIRGEARDVYIAIAEGLGDFEQGRALSALVKNERAGAKQ